ncbi:hypothetical protein IW150_002266 [Coemansia sp. RSA 2607]|nr:hypothetical protein IW150_002266 [Coemansia sp. RSA 2607]KAJ2396184.1 hypothetical protein GGI05_001243 [Coemansia sp. RSA 2603]
MATEDIRNPVFYNIDSDINYRNAGMCPNPEGIWLIKDVDEFKTMHPFHGKPNILSRFAPKYLTK